jgi:hypothetical protein
MELAKKSKIWPVFQVPREREWLTVLDVTQSPDSKKQEMIKKWSRSVWNAWKPQHEKIASLLKKYLDI